MNATNRKTIPIGSIEDWNSINTTTVTTNDTTIPTKLPLLDLRSPAAFRQRHIRGAIHMPLATVRQRSYELPPRQCQFAVMVPSANDNNLGNNNIYPFF